MTNAMLSRVADSLYWMSRYLERAEHTARLLMVNLNLMLDTMPAKAVERWKPLFAALNAPLPADNHDTPIVYALTLDPENANSILNCISNARENARQVRAEISSEMWEHLNQMYLGFKVVTIEAIMDEGPFTFLTRIRNGSHLFEGITDSTMNHGEGWHFIQVGRYIERANAIANLLTVHRHIFHTVSADLNNEIYLDLLGILKSCTAFEAYCKIYTANLITVRVAEMLLLDAEFPHSLRFAVNRLEDALNYISQKADKRKNIRANRLVGRLKADLSFDQIDEVLSGDLGAYLQEIQQKCAEIHHTLQEAYIAYPIQLALIY